MKNKNIHTLCLAAAALLLTACDNFLDVRPKSEIIDRDLFETAQGVEDALYGVYTAYRGADIYGKNISTLFPEALSHNFSAKGGSEYDYMASGLFTRLRSQQNATWKSSYTAISYTNNILQNLGKKSPDDFKHYNLYRGEALTLRAMLHFDLVRLYAVDINSANAAARAKGIPYVTVYSHAITPFSSVEEVYEKIIADLEEAERCLEEDRQYMTWPRTNQGTEFIHCRQIHANLYAAKALLARVYWMKNDLATAARYAREVIDSGLFPLMSPSDFIQYERGVLNMKETIFGIYSPSFADACYTIFGKSSSTDMLALPDDYRDLYTSTQGPSSEGSDLRLSAWFGSTFEVSPACIKLINPLYDSGSTDAQYTGTSYLGINLIRVPEMYYILAEALLESDPRQATAWFDQVIESRGMLKFADRENPLITADDIYIERQKEYYGEGQHWFNMKRLKKDIVVNSSTTLDGRDDDNYRLLIPAAEDNRN